MIRVLLKIGSYGKKETLTQRESRSGSQKGGGKRGEGGRGLNQTREWDLGGGTMERRGGMRSDLRNKVEGCRRGCVIVVENSLKQGTVGDDD